MVDRRKSKFRSRVRNQAHPAWQYLAVQKPPFPAFADDLATSTSSLLRLLMTTDDKVPEDGVQLSMMDPSDKHVDKVKGDSSPRSSSSSSSSSDEAGPSNPAPAYDGPSDKYEGDPGVSDKKKVDTAEPDAGDIAVQVPSEPPPEFTHYKPEVEIDNDGNLFSHDHHLNEDGEALYRFILTQAHLPPSFLLKCHGSHQERRTRTVSRMENGRNVTRTETYYETVTDFSFIINITGHLILEGEDTPIWIVGDRDATYRGSVVRQVDNTPMPVGEGEAEPTENRDIEAGKAVMGRKTWRRKATEAEKQNAAGRRYRREETGLPPWVLLSGEVHGTEACIESERSRRRWQYATHSQAEGFDDSELLPPPKTLRDWADEYCASKKMLKEFQFRKVVFGWNISQLRMAVHTTIRANYLRPEEPSIDFKIGANEIDVRPDNRLSRMLSKTWVYVLLWIFLVYPLIIWPFKRFSSRGGGDWRVAGSAFALSKWAHLDDSSPGQTVEEYQELYNRTHPEGERLVLKQTPNGVSRLVGKREGEWFAEWEDTIGALVRQRCISSEPISIPMDGARGRAGSGLDGYNPH
ncbi:hypothetical protein FRB99_006094 [Tulasnella sp. 403]|nr:hypothetical protein FRB99_006094 [Tulasnella sp. 403]